MHKSVVLHKMGEHLADYAAREAADNGDGSVLRYAAEEMSGDDDSPFRDGFWMKVADYVGQAYEAIKK